MKVRIAKPIIEVVVDTRERTPWAFPDDVRILSAGLPAGDYSIAGAETSFALERKSLGDYLGSITFERERFKRELERLKTYDFAAVLVEASLADIFARRYRAAVHPASVVGTSVAITLDYRVPVLWCGDRHHAADVALRFLRRFHARHLARPEGAAA